MINVFLELLEEAHGNGKRSDTGFKPVKTGLCMYFLTVH